MKIDRLIGILSLLLQRRSVTAPELAEHFEVSRRTINRDVETLCQAGIPIVTRQGAGGGIAIMEGYRVDRTVLSAADMQAILAGLRSLDSVSDTRRYAQLMEKLSAGASDVISAGPSFLIDLSSWYKDALAPKIRLIQNAIEAGVVIGFDYLSPNGESRREIEPYYLVFRWSSWYVWGWCRTKEDYRLFKLNRMDELHLTGAGFEKRPAPLPELSTQHIFPGGIRVKALFTQDCAWRLAEEFGRDCYVSQPDGRLLFQADYTDKDNLISWLLTFGEKAELLEPIEIRRELAEKIKRMGENYGVH
ncbi:MAG: helix-turn-helix transcriptional regulator [Candidatus Limivicinus sp.]